jgi:hypothetical protein
VYLIVFFFIDFPAFTPITRADYAKPPFSPGEANGHDTAVYFAKAKEALLAFAMAQIRHNQAAWIKESSLRLLERNAMFETLMRSFASSHSNIARDSAIWQNYHIKVWLSSGVKETDSGT